MATTGGALPARWVIHTVGPVYATEEDPAALLASCHIESLRVADELGAVTVAFPAISTGAYGYPLDEAARVAIESFRSADTEVREVRFVLFGRDAYMAFERALGRLKRSHRATASIEPMADLSTVEGVHESQADIQLVDCREQYEWDAGRIQGALHIPLNDVMAGVGTDVLDLAKPVAVICRSGNRSELAATMLQARGYDATNVEGGMEAWAAAGYEFSASRRVARPRGLIAGAPATIDGLILSGVGRPHGFLDRHRIEGERIRSLFGESSRGGKLRRDLFHPAVTRNSPPIPSGLSIGECSANRASRATSRTFGLRARKRTRRRPVAIQGSTGCTRGEPSSRSVAWKHTVPSNRSRPNAANSGSARSNSAQVAIAAYPSPRCRTWTRRVASWRRRWAPTRSSRIRSPSGSTPATRRWSRAPPGSWSSPPPRTTSSRASVRPPRTT